MYNINNNLPTSKLEKKLNPGFTWIFEFQCYEQS